MNDIRKPLWPKILATVVLLAVLDLLAIGPWVYVRGKFGPPKPIEIVGNAIFIEPANALMNVLPEALSQRYQNYVLWFVFVAKS